MILGLTLEQIAWFFVPMLLVGLALFFAFVVVMTYQVVKHPPMTAQQKATMRHRARRVTQIRWSLFGLVTLTAMIAAVLGHILVTWILFLTWGCVTILLRGLAYGLKYWAKVSPDASIPLEFDPTWDDPKPKAKP
jgi:hypothetical protein